MTQDNYTAMCRLVRRWMREELDNQLEPLTPDEAVRVLRNTINNDYQPLNSELRWQHLADIATWATIAATLTKQDTEHSTPQETT